MLLLSFNFVPVGHPLTEIILTFFVGKKITIITNIKRSHRSGGSITTHLSEIIRRTDY